MLLRRSGTIRAGAQIVLRPTLARSLRSPWTLAATPDSFPIRREISFVVTSRLPLPEQEGYGPAEAMIEVLDDAGILARYLIDPDSSGIHHREAGGRLGT